MSISCFESPLIPNDEMVKGIGAAAAWQGRRRMKTDRMSAQSEVCEVQTDGRFGDNGENARIYLAWPFGPLPVAFVLGWFLVQAARSPGNADVLITVSIFFIFALWCCVAGIVMHIEGKRAIQRAVIYGDRVVCKTYFGREITIHRDTPIGLVSCTVDRKYLWASIGTTFMAIDRPNWRVLVDGNKTFLMNGGHFHPHDIFRKVRAKE